MKVIGIDPSLTSTGIALVDTDQRVPALTDRVVIRKTDGLARLRAIRAGVCSWAGSVDLAVIEGPSYGSQNGQQGHHERGGLWWLLVDMLDRFHVPYAVVPPTVRAKYATGKGNAGKDAVLIAVMRRYATVEEISGNDEADALVLAAMGARWLGHPVETSLPKPNLAAMEKAAWPHLVSL